MKFIFILSLSFIFYFIMTIQAALFVGVGHSDITPPIDTPSAGYTDRQGAGMIGIHDPLLATAVFIDNHEKQIAICSVDHLGFDYSMVQKIKEKIHQNNGLENCDVFVSSSHTHSGGGAFFDIPIIGEILAGKFDPLMQEKYVNGTVEAILKAFENTRPAKIGIGRTKISGLSHYRQGNRIICFF